MLSCTCNPGLERTFQRAGENRSELEKVLRHYEGDGRKHRAALFLLEHPVGVCVELCDYVAYLLEREAGMGSTYGIEKGSEGGIDGHPANEGRSEATSAVSMEGKI